MNVPFDHFFLPDFWLCFKIICSGEEGVGLWWKPTRRGRASWRLIIR